MKKRLWSYFVVLCILLPFALMVILSLAGDWRYPDIFPQNWTGKHWKSLMGAQNDLGESLLLSIGISAFVAAISTISGFMTSKFIAFHKRRDRLLLIAYCPFVLSPVIYAACLQFYFIKMGLSGNLGGVVLGQLMIAYPFAVIICTGYWNEQLRAMEQLVATLGGTRFQAYTRVLIPVSKGILLVCFFQTFLISWFEYGLTTLIGVGKIQTLTLKVYQYINEANAFQAALSSLLLFIPPAVLLWINKRYVFSQDLR